MDENEVIDRLCSYLKSHGWQIVSHVAAGDRGIDVVATDPSKTKFYIEAKGGTSSRVGSSCHGKPYTKTQVFDVTAKGLMQCLHHLADKKSQVQVGFAYPEGKYFSDYIDPVRPLLQTLGLTFFHIRKDGTVETTVISDKA